MKIKSKLNHSRRYSRHNRYNDYPERQVGYPERNDVSNPNEEMERLHVDFKTLDLSRTSHEDLAEKN